MEPIIDRAAKSIRFQVRQGTFDPSKIESILTGTTLTGDQGKKVRAAFYCAACREGIAYGDYIDDEANAGRMDVLPMAVVAESGRNRLYLNFSEDQACGIHVANQYYENEGVSERIPNEISRGTFASNAQGRTYGFKSFADYFTKRQLISLDTFRDLLVQVWQKIVIDSPNTAVEEEKEYANAICTYLSFCLDKNTLTNTTLATWQSDPDRLTQAYSRQAIAMTWSFAEANPLSEAGGGFILTTASLSEVLLNLPLGVTAGVVSQKDAALGSNAHGICISTDPPYYGNINYSDLSDYFYDWLRRSLNHMYPELFGTILTPKQEELIADPYRFNGNKDQAEIFFEKGLGAVFDHTRSSQHQDYPLTVFYAFKQVEGDVETDNNADGTDDSSVQNGSGGRVVASTGWEKMLEGLIKAGFAISGTGPVRTELITSLKKNVGALASSIVLVCRPRPENAKNTTRLELIRALRRELPQALRDLQHGNIAPVDLAQAAIGPGMAVFSRYKAVLEADGSPMRVRTALQLINAALDEVLAEQEGEYDADTRWAIAWFEQYGADEGPYGTAETLSKAKNTSVRGMEDAGVVVARAGKVRLLRRDELPEDWRPDTDRRLTAWEATQHLVHALDTQGEQGAAELLARIPADRAEIARDLAYRLYTTCERKKWAQEALAYNALVVAWPEIARLAAERTRGGPVQTGFDLS